MLLSKKSVTLEAYSLFKYDKFVIIIHYKIYIP